MRSTVSREIIVRRRFDRIASSAREFADLVRPVDRDPDLVVTLADPGREPGQCQDRAAQPPRHGDGRDARGDEDRGGDRREPQIAGPLGAFIAPGQVRGQGERVALDPARGHGDRHHPE
jgi:hypothetical protein